jgi:Flp pilus assembly protein TadD
VATVAEAFALALAYHNAGQLSRAEHVFRQIMQVDPHHADSLHMLGVIAHQVGQNDAAIGYIREALRLNPANGMAHNNLGRILRDQGKLEEAVACLREGLRLQPKEASSYNNLGVALCDHGPLDEAASCFHEAIRLKPDYAEAHHNLGNALRELGRLNEASGSYEHALSLQPNAPDVRWDRALLWLLQGHYDKGWPEYEWRWRSQNRQPRALGQPLWDGQPLGGRTILLHAEQALGDTLQFVRYAPLVQQRGGRVLLECQPPLRRLLTRSPGIDALLVQGERLPAFEWHAPLLSLPGILGTTLDSIPAALPYLDVDPLQVERWRRELADGEFKVGIAWQGRPTHKRDRQRSVPLGQLAPLGQVKGVCLYSLQKGPGVEQLKTTGFNVTDLGSRFEDYADLAAVMKCVDLVVTVDTGVAHCAGGLGVPVWVALSFVPDWRWLMKRQDSPWYPTMRLFRQKQSGQWAEVFACMAGELSRLRQHQGRGTSAPDGC